jgi:hypothetical protein
MKRRYLIINVAIGLVSLINTIEVAASTLPKQNITYNVVKNVNVAKLQEINPYLTKNDSIYFEKNTQKENVEKLQYIVEYLTKNDPIDFENDIGSKSRQYTFDIGGIKHGIELSFDYDTKKVDLISIILRNDKNNVTAMFFDHNLDGFCDVGSINEETIHIDYASGKISEPINFDNERFKDVVQRAYAEALKQIVQSDQILSFYVK